MADLTARAHCFDRSGMYDKSLSCPVAAPDQPLNRRGDGSRIA